MDDKLKLLLSCLPDALVLTVGEDELLSGVEDGAADIVVVPAASVHLPGLKKLTIT